MAKSDVSIIFLAPKFPGIIQSDVLVSLSSTFNRRNLSPQREFEVDQIWKGRIEKNPRLFNASKFRYHSMDVKNGVTELRLGLTSYKDFLGTNWAPDAKQLRSEGQDHYGNSQAYMSDALGVGNFVLTKDNYVIFIRRSQTVGEAAGLWDIPGGHPEPGEVPGGSSSPDEVELSSLAPADVLAEFYESTLREIRDEVNVPMDSLSQPVLMGVAANHQSSGRPSAEFYVKCSVTKSEVLKLYQEGGAEAEESSNITFIPIKDIPTIEENMVWKEMAPSAKGCMKLFNALSAGSHNYEV